MKEPIGEICSMLQTYFDGWYEADPDKLARAFHPDCHLFCVIDGKLDNDAMPKVLDGVAHRTSGASRGDARHDRILSLDLASPTTALAKVQLSINRKLFTDYLSLIRLDSEWRIISKVFSFEPLQDLVRDTPSRAEDTA